MSTKTNIAPVHYVPSEGNPFVDAFADVGPLDDFVVKKDEVATDMAALMAHCNVGRADLTKKLGWPRSRVSHLLSGKCNLTLKTIHEFTSALNKDYSVVFHDVGAPCFSQPWHLPHFSTFTLSTTEAWIFHTSHHAALETALKPLALGVTDDIKNFLTALNTIDSNELSTHLLPLKQTLDSGD